MHEHPESLNGALEMLADGRRVVLAGGTDIYPATTAQSLQGPVLDITGIATLRGITRADGHWRIGACTTWAEIACADLPPALAALQQAAREVGGVQIQNAGTIGGNLCNASPAADGVPPLLVLDATVELVSMRGRRVLPLADFLIGPRRTARRADELLSALLLPDSAMDAGSVFLKLGARRHLVISIVMVAARLSTQGGRISGAALAVGACSATALRLTAVEAALIGAPATDRLPALIDPAAVAAALSPLDDLRASAAYRTQAATRLLRRAVASLVPVPA